MIHTSKAYKEMIAGNVGNREFCIRDTITFSDGRKLQLSLDDVIAYMVNDATTESGKFQIGAAIIKEYSITLSNFDGKFNGYVFEGANIVADIGLKLADGSWEILRKGVFRIVKAVGVETISITAYDSMLFFDRPYSESSLQYPATLLDIIRDACTCCQMAFDTSTVQNSKYIVSSRPSDEALTFRDVISHAAQIMGCYARIDRLDKLQFGWYAFDNDVNIWGGIFDKDMPYSTGDDLHGGAFMPWDTGDVYYDGFATMSDYHHFHDLQSKDINTDDIVITGVKVIGLKAGSESAPEAVYGKEGYMIVLENNPLIISDTDVKAVARHVGAKLVYNAFRPMTISAQSDPAIEAGDCALVSVSEQSPVIYTLVTNTTFSLGGKQSIACSAETPTEKNYTKYNAQTRIIAKTNQETGRKLDAYDIAVQNMNQLAANTMGFYATTVKQADGSILAYRHDKPKLSESKIVYKSGIDGFWVTQDYRGTDAATTWKAGFDSNGNAALNMLSVIGINFDWAHGGTLTLGGVGNQNGLLKILDGHGFEIGNLGNNGVSLFDWNKTIRITMSKDNILFENMYNSEWEEAAKIYPGLITDINSNHITDAIGLIVQVPNAFSFQNRNGDNVLMAAQSEVDSNYREIFLCNETRVEGGLTVEKDLWVSGTIYGVVDDGEIVPEPIGMNRVAYRTMNVNQISTPTVSDVGSGKINQKGDCYIYISDVFTSMVSNSAEYQVFLQKEGAGDLWVNSKDSAFFVVKGTPDLKFSWEIKAVQKNHEYEYFDEMGVRNNTVPEPDDLQAIFADDLIQYDEEMEEFI